MLVPVHAADTVCRGQVGSAVRGPLQLRHWGPPTGVPLRLLRPVLPEMVDDFQVGHTQSGYEDYLYLHSIIRSLGLEKAKCIIK